MTVTLLRPQFYPYFTLILDNGYTEEFEPDECRQWFKDRGADMDKMEKALDHCWNFSKVTVTFTQYREPNTLKLPHMPKI